MEKYKYRIYINGELKKETIAHSVGDAINWYEKKYGLIKTDHVIAISDYEQDVLMEQALILGERQWGW